jgi:pimeloyl-ACP methyl ester carboxylesterase
MSFETLEFDLRGRRLRVARAGSGACILYLHGIDGLKAAMPALEQLADHCEVIAPSHPGFGEDLPEWLDGIEDYAYLYLDFLSALRRQRVHIVGQSLGGWLGLEMAIRSPLDIATITLVGSAGIHLRNVPRGDIFLWSPEKIIQHQFHDAAMVQRLLEHERTMTSKELEEKLCNQRAVARVAWAPPLYNAGLVKWLHRVSMPAHIIWGEEDRMFPIAYAYRFKEMLPRATLTVVPDCGHRIELEKPEGFREKVVRWIAENSQ